MASVRHELKLLRARAGRERAALLSEPPCRPTTKQRQALERLAQAGGALDAEAVHFRTGLVLTARRWANLQRREDRLYLILTEAGRHVLASE